MSLTKVSYSMINGATVNVLDFGAVGDGTTDNTTAIQAALNSAGDGVVYFPKGIYISGSLSIPVNTSLRGESMNSVVLKLKNGTNPTGFLQTAGFASLTNTNSNGGTFNSQISEITIDGNKANNTSGNGINIYGKAFKIQNIVVQNCAQVGIYTEYSGGDDFSTPAGTLEAVFDTIRVLLCGGSGIVSVGPHDLIASEIVSFTNGGWGWDVQTSMNMYSVNTYTCTLGGIWVRTVTNASGTHQGSIQGSAVIGSTGTGWGALFEAGGNNLSASIFGGPIALEIKSAANNIHGIISNSTTAGLKLGNASASGNFQLVMQGNEGLVFDVANSSASYPSIITAWFGDAVGTLQNGAIYGTYLFNGARVGNQLSGGAVIQNGKLYPPNSALNAQTVCGLYYDTSPPSSGSFLRGDRFFNSLPSVGQPKGWICTVSGTPGTWVSEGNL
jgi:hypothetical protein